MCCHPSLPPSPTHFPHLSHSLPSPLPPSSFPLPPTHPLLQCSPSDSTLLWHFWKVRMTWWHAPPLGEVTWVSHDLLLHPLLLQNPPSWRPKTQPSASSFLRP